MAIFPPFRSSPGVVLLAAALAFAPPCPASGQGPPALQAVIEKARTLESQGRPDLAALTWQQVLLLDPGNAEATSGVARAARTPRTTLPPAPAAQSSRTRLDQAAALAASGQYTQAMAIYRDVLGPEPSPGDDAVAFYETEAATEGGRAHAVAGLRALVRRRPTEARYQVALARILTYSPATRAEGRRMLARFPSDPRAVEALRQALLWDARNPATAAEVRRYLALHPDPQLAQALQVEPPPVAAVAEPRAAPMSSTAAEEQAAFRDLHSGHIGEAELRFRAILDRHPSSAPALAGMGYLRMQQGNFGGALSFLTQAKQQGLEDPSLDTALDAARFWYTMGEGQSALAGNNLSVAEKQFQSALAMRPSSPDALDGLGSTLLKTHRAEAAALLYRRFTAAQPGAAAAWRGLVQAQVAAGNPAEALATERHLAATLHAQLMRDPGFLQALAAAAAATGLYADAQRFLDAALDLPFPTGAAGQQAEVQVQYASLLLQAHRFTQAEGLFRQVLADLPPGAVVGTPAWVGLLRAQHLEGRDEQVLQTLESLPPAVYTAALRDPEFDSTVAALFAGQGKLDTAQDVLEKALALQAAEGEIPAVSLQIQLAAIYLERNRPQLAFPLYGRILSQHPTRLDGWNGLLSALHTTGRDAEALAQLPQIPPGIRLQLEGDPAYLETVAHIYRSLGQPRTAGLFLARVQQVDALRHTPAPAGIELELAAVTFQGGDDASLYAQLLALGSRTDLTEAQRHALQGQWGAWALRRANQASAAGDSARAVDLLNATAAAFPENHDVLDALPPAYARAGQPRQAEALFQRQDLSHASAATFRSAIGAAQAASDKRQAAVWLRQGLAAHPADPEMLLVAARAEEARGKTRRAAELYRAALAAAPTVHEDAGAAGESSTARPPRDLAALLAPAGPQAEPQAPAQPSPSAPVPLTSTPPASSPPAGQPSSALPVDTTPRFRNASASTQLAASQAPPGRRSANTTRKPADTIYGPYVPYGPALAAQAEPAQRTGQSHPPGEDPSFLIQHAGYDSQASSAIARQIPKPALPPATLPQAGQYADSQGQQYPQPRRSVLPSARHRPARAPARAEKVKPPSSPPAGAPPVATPPAEVAAAPPQLPPMEYPSLAQLEGQAPGSFGSRRGPPADGPAAPSAPAVRSDRDQAERELASLEAGYSGSLAATGVVRARSGSAGLDRLTALEAPAEFSAVLARNVRAAVLPRPVFLNSGTLDPAGPGASRLPLLGTRPTSLATPQQIANGLGGEFQLVAANYGVAAGYTPYEFLVPNLTARLRVRPASGPVTLLAERQPVTQTQLSYAGLRDPSALNNVWGGVVSTGATLRLDLGDPRAAFSFAGHGATLTGRHVERNTAFTAEVSGRFRLYAWPRAGALSLGGAFQAAHFTRNERGLSYGQGGYFSPNYSFLAAAPLSFVGHVGTGFHYRVSGAGGVQTYQERAAPWYPLDRTLQAAALAACSPVTLACASYPAYASTSAHYAVDATGAYRDRRPLVLWRLPCGEQHQLLQPGVQRLLPAVCLHAADPA